MLKNILGGAVLVAATTVVTGHVVSQDKDHFDANAQQEMEMWIKAGMPGPEHIKMEKSAGTWLQENKMWQYPGSEPTVSESVARFRSIFGGRFLIEEMTGVGDFMGQTMVMEGLGIFGYDNMKNKHFFYWFDSMSTVPMYGEGARNSKGDIEYLSEYPKPAGGVMKFKSVQTDSSGDESNFVMYMEDGEGGWFEHMQVTSHRQ